MSWDESGWTIQRNLPKSRSHATVGIIIMLGSEIIDGWVFISILSAIRLSLISKLLLMPGCKIEINPRKKAFLVHHFLGNYILIRRDLHTITWALLLGTHCIAPGRKTAGVYFLFLFAVFQLFLEPFFGNYLSLKKENSNHSGLTFSKKK